MNKEKEIEKINSCIGELVYEKTQLKKAYNYYHGIRDAEQFKHIEDNFGIGVPTSVGFTPLIKKHIDVLIGEYLELDQDMQVSCKDETTISNIMRDKQLLINRSIYSFLKNYVENTILDIITGDREPSKDPVVVRQLENIKNNIDKNYVSEYEKAAQYILSYIKESRYIDIKNKFRELFTDLLIAGICYYRVRPNSNKDNLKLEILNPLDTFIERNYNEFYLNKSPRVVVRRWLNKNQILEEYGSELTSEAKNKLDDSFGKGWDNAGSVWVRGTSNFTGYNDLLGTRDVNTVGVLGGLEVTPVFPWNEAGSMNYKDKPVIPVYECEWIEWSNSKNCLVRHEGIRIGGEIYITRGESETIVRSASDPKNCTLSVNGMFFNDKNGNPFSIMLSTMDLQDKYDLLLYYRDNLIATSGTVGDWLDVGSIPSFLGDALPDRVQKWIAYKKTGLALFDSSQEGANLINTSFNGFDDTVKAQSIQAIQMAIESIEAQASSITGVFKEKLGGVQQRDAVSNVKMGVRNSTLLTKGYFYAMDLMYKECNYDLLNLAKIVYKKGLSGTMILGDKYKQLFTIMPEHYTMTDFDIHISDSSETYALKQQMQQLCMEMIGANVVEPDVVVDILTAKSKTYMKESIKDSMRRKKAENDQLKQLTQQLEEMKKGMKQQAEQIEDLSAQNKKLQSELQKNSAEKLKLEHMRIEIEQQKVDDKKSYDDRVIKTKEKQIEAEVAQLYDSNPYNDSIKHV